MRIYDAIDFYWSDDGDFAIDDTGDLMDTSYDPLKSIKQEIIDRISGNQQGWLYQPALGANLDRFVGEPNTRENGKAIQHAVINSLLYGNLVDIGDLKVLVTPLSASMIAIRIQIACLPTSRNSRALPITLSFLYDYSDNHVYAVQGNYVNHAI